MANCKKCGAGLQPGARVCEYCGSVADVPETPRAYSPSAAGAGAPADAVRFKRVSVVLMIVFTIFTLGIYMGAWFFMRRREFGQLSPKIAGKTGGVFGGLLAVQIFYVLGMFGMIGNADPNAIAGFNAFSYVVLGLTIYASIIGRAALAEYASARGSDFAGSMVWTVLFQSLYLQSQINRMIDARILGEAGKA